MCFFQRVYWPIGRPCWTKYPVIQPDRMSVKPSTGSPGPTTGEITRTPNTQPTVANKPVQIPTASPVSTLRPDYVRLDESSSLFQPRSHLRLSIWYLHYRVHPLAGISQSPIDRTPYPQRRKKKNMVYRMVSGLPADELGVGAAANAAQSQNVRHSQENSCISVEMFESISELAEVDSHL